MLKLFVNILWKVFTTFNDDFMNHDI